MNNFTLSVNKTISKFKMLEKDDFIVLGLSGGSDSVSLFYFLLDNDFKFCAVHINHQIREESMLDEVFVTQLCENNNVELFVFKENITLFAKENKISIEEAGRKIRYEKFRKTKIEKSATKIAVAHNKNDRAETLIMRMLRGTGTTGLKSIEPVINDIIRPLINCDKKTIENYLITNNYNWIEDKSNQTLDYTRNKIRLQVIPYIEDNFNKNIINSLCKTSEIISLDESFLRKTAEECYYKCLISEKELNINTLLSFDVSIVYRILRLSLEKMFNGDILKNISFKNIEDIYKIITNKGNFEINIASNILAIKQYNILKFENTNKNQQIEFYYQLPLNKLIYVKEARFYIAVSTKNIEKTEKLDILYTKHFNYDKIKGAVILRSRKNGDKISIKNVGTKKLKDFFIDAKIPTETRNTIPLITFGENQNIEWIVNLKASVNEITKNDLKNQKTQTNEKDCIITIQIWEDKNV